MKSKHFKNKTCLIVGSNGGIGSCISKKLTDLGANVINASRSSGNSIDITDVKSIQKLKMKVQRKYEKIDFIFNTAGIACYKPLNKITNLELGDVINVNLIGPILLTRYFVGLMSTNGFMVHIGSMAGIAYGHKYFSVYSASKEGLAGFLRSVAAEYHDINFILVTPSGINTNLPYKSYGSDMLIKKFLSSKLDSVEDVCDGILNKIRSHRYSREIRLFPTKLSSDVYEKISK